MCLLNHEKKQQQEPIFSMCKKATPDDRPSETGTKIRTSELSNQTLQFTLASATLHYSIIIPRPSPQAKRVPLEGTSL